MCSSAPGSAVTVRPVFPRIYSMPRRTTCMAASGEICLNSNTVERLRMALKT